MGWSIQCSNSACGNQTWSNNIVELINSHTDENGWFICGTCKNHGYIEKSFDLQEPGDTWEPLLRGVIPLGNPNDTYQPFVFLVSYEPDSPATDIWFSYFKDLRASGGRLKLGYGPGGPPVLNTKQLLGLLKDLITRGCVPKGSVVEVLNELDIV